MQKSCLDFATFALQDCQDLSSNLPILELAYICPVTLSKAMSQRHVYVSNTQTMKDEEVEENTEKNDHRAQLFWSLDSGESP